MLLASVVDVLGLGGVAAACGAMLYLAHRIEPHWVAKDRSRFLTTAQEIDQWGTPAGRRHEVRVQLDPAEPVLRVSRRSLMRPTSGLWTISAKAPASPRGKAVYVLRRVPGEEGAGPPSAAQMLLRVPAGSTVVPLLDARVDGARPSTGGIDGAPPPTSGTQGAPPSTSGTGGGAPTE